MLTIGSPGILAWTFYMVIVGLIWRTISYQLVQKNPKSSLGRAMLFIY